MMSVSFGTIALTGPANPHYEQLLAVRLGQSGSQDEQMQPIRRQQRVVLGAVKQGVGQEGLEVTGSQGVRRALELDQSKLGQILHQPRQDSPDGRRQFAPLPVQQQEVDWQRFLADRHFLLHLVVAAQLPAQHVGQQRVPPGADLPWPTLSGGRLADPSRRTGGHGCRAQGSV
jgi:hypothetical protein